MNRRDFLWSMGLSAPAIASAQQALPKPDPVESMRPGPTPAIALNHLGFLPKSKKILICRFPGDFAPEEFLLRDISGPHPPFRKTRPLKRVSNAVINCQVGDFSDIEREGMYQISAGGELSVPFFIRPDVWRRTLPKAVGYHRQQRCGVEVPNVHAICHLDDARRRDNGQHVDVTGGWHDAGDLRKWMSATMMNGFGLLHLARNLGESWDAAGSGLKPLHEEMLWGNRYFLKMQDSDGLVWNDAAGGVNGDNSDNHWTDNRIGTGDDRYINTAKPGLVQAMFVTLQAMMAQEFGRIDARYAQICLKAGGRCWDAARRAGGTRELGWWTLAAIEMHRATGHEQYATAAVQHGGILLGLQNVDFIAGQKQIRAFWRMSETDSNPYGEAVDSAIPGIALLELARAFPQHQDAGRWRDAVRLHLDEYVLPMAAQSPYEIVPYGVFIGSPTPELYRPLAGEMTYRYFMPVRKQSWWVGMTSHLECYALLLAMAAGDFRHNPYRDLAYRQLEWIMGANPFGACLMTAEGMRNPYPHSRFVGLIPGGIMNGIAGNTKDEPVLDTENGFDWRTCEYWSPHNAYYIWTHSVLEGGKA